MGAAPNFRGDGRPTLNIGIRPRRIAAKGRDRFKTELAQLYGIVEREMPMTQRIFQGLGESAHVGDDVDAGSKLLLFTWTPRFDALPTGGIHNFGFEYV